MASQKADLIRPIYEEWGRVNWRPAFDVYDSHFEWGWSSERDDKVVRLEIFASRQKAIQSVETAVAGA